MDKCSRATRPFLFLNRFYFYWKKIFSKTNRPISIKLDANYPCMKAIQVCLDKGTDPHKGEIITKMQILGGVI
jgi:hypothetical protein